MATGPTTRGILKHKKQQRVKEHHSETMRYTAPAPRILDRRELVEQVGQESPPLIRVYPRVQYVRFKQYANVFVQGQQNVLLGGGMVYHPQLQMVLDNGVVTNIRLSNEELPTSAK